MGRPVRAHKSVQLRSSGVSEWFHTSAFLGVDAACRRPRTSWPQLRPPQRSSARPVLRPLSAAAASASDTAPGARSRVRPAQTSISAQCSRSILAKRTPKELSAGRRVLHAGRDKHAGHSGGALETLFDHYSTVINSFVSLYRPLRCTAVNTVFDACLRGCQHTKLPCVEWWCSGILMRLA